MLVLVPLVILFSFSVAGYLLRPPQVTIATPARWRVAVIATAAFLTTFGILVGAGWPAWVLTIGLIAVFVKDGLA